MKINLNLNFARLLARPGPIGLDIGARQVKAVQLASVGRDGRRVLAAASFPRATPNQPRDADEAARVAEVLDRQGFVGRTVVVGLGPAQLMSSMLELPARAPGVPIEQIARMELARVHGRDAAGFEFAQWEVPSPAPFHTFETPPRLDPTATRVLDARVMPERHEPVSGTSH